jgi:uncharacterized repeat protein (TIGR03987 family)
LLIISSTLITLALIFYSIGVWAERIARYLKSWHLFYFWLGFLNDISGTFAMHLLSKGRFDITEPHTLTGQIALWLMLVHAIWATLVVKGDEQKKRKNFHRYSIIVWLFWLIPYFSGMYIGMSRN